MIIALSFVFVMDLLLIAHNTRVRPDYIGIDYALRNAGGGISDTKMSIQAVLFVAGCLALLIFNWQFAALLLGWFSLITGIVWQIQYLLHTPHKPD